MNPNHLAKLGVVVLVMAAVVIVIRVKQAASSSSADEASGAIGSLVLTDQPGTSPRAARSDDVESAWQSPERSAGLPQADAALPRLLDFGAGKCIPCKKMAPILEALREDFVGQFEVVFIDVWKDRQAAVPYGIKLIPTQVFFDEEGNELFRHQGFFSREDILATWSELGYRFAMSSSVAGE